MYFPDLGGLVRNTIIALAVFVPLGVWKLVDLAMWACSHVTIATN